MDGSLKDFPPENLPVIFPPEDIFLLNCPRNFTLGYLPSKRFNNYFSLVKWPLHETQSDSWSIWIFKPVWVLLLVIKETHIRTAGEFRSLAKFILTYSENKIGWNNQHGQFNCYLSTRASNASLIAISSATSITYPYTSQAFLKFWKTGGVGFLACIRKTSIKAFYFT